MSGKSGLGQTHRGLAVGDRVGGQHTGPGDAVGLPGSAVEAASSGARGFPQARRLRPSEARVG